MTSRTPLPLDEEILLLSLDERTVIIIAPAEVSGLFPVSLPRTGSSSARCGSSG